MTAEAYEGLFHLTAGFSAFLALALGFRLWSDRTNTTAAQGPDLDAWRTVEDLQIVARRKETEDIVTLQLRRTSGKRFPEFKAGQFLTVQIGADAKKTRSYSISSSASNRDTLQIAVKRIAGGLGSEFVHSLKQGELLRAYPPSGHFTDIAEGDHPRVFVAGGIGITPLLSMLLTREDRGVRGPLYLFYGARTQQDLAFCDELNLLAKKNNNFKFIPILSHQKWAGETGFITLDLVKKFCADLSKAELFMCGPVPMMDALTEQWIAAGLSLDRVHSERFASPADLDTSKIPMRNAKLSMNGQSYSYSGRESLLEFFEAQGAPVTYACRVGVCGSCKCKTTAKVSMLTDTGLTTQEKREGLVLACVAYPESDGDVSFVT